jgi:hypothetical protein
MLKRITISTYYRRKAWLLIALLKGARKLYREDIRGAYRRGSQLCRVGLGEIRVDRQNGISLAPRPLTALKIMQEALGDGE